MASETSLSCQLASCHTGFENNLQAHGELRPNQDKCSKGGPHKIISFLFYKELEPPANFYLYLFDFLKRGILP